MAKITNQTLKKKKKTGKIKKKDNVLWYGEGSRKRSSSSTTIFIPVSKLKRFQTQQTKAINEKGNISNANEREREREREAG